ncbi:unnamed protein product [Protopolystoma xenopodis]|uniref:Uncharacterized protein n=1 Tax=Protopolystoma xenopodis TaxID=117903 RepID=A0A448XE15_9PLAT|nr:unnamed protein product [Protopolystoma xenopodis]
MPPQAGLVVDRRVNPAGSDVSASAPLTWALPTGAPRGCLERKLISDTVDMQIRRSTRQRFSRYAFSRATTGHLLSFHINLPINFIWSLQHSYPLFAQMTVSIHEQGQCVGRQIIKVGFFSAQIPKSTISPVTNALGCVKEAEVKEKAHCSATLITFSTSPKSSESQISSSETFDWTVYDTHIPQDS